MKKQCYMALNVLIPISLGAIIYYLFSPNVVFVKIVDEILGINRNALVLCTENAIFCFVRNYFLDMLWAYALVICLFWIKGNNAAEIKKIFMVAFGFSTTMEIIQMTPWIKGTYDPLDIVVEFVAEVVAVFIIKIISKEKV